MGFLAFLVDVALQILNGFKFRATKAAIADTHSFWWPYLVWLFFTMGFSTLSGCLCAWGAPLAAGSGIPETKTYLNGVHIKGKAGIFN